eukprot:458644_1
MAPGGHVSPQLWPHLVESTENILKMSLAKCPNSIDLWLMAFKVQKNQNNILVARSILKRALEINSDQSNVGKIYMALCELEVDCNNFGTAKIIMENARNNCNKSDVWLYSCKLFRRLNEGVSDEELNLELIAV